MVFGAVVVCHGTIRRSYENLPSKGSFNDDVRRVLDPGRMSARARGSHEPIRGEPKAPLQVQGMPTDDPSPLLPAFLQALLVARSRPEVSSDNDVHPADEVASDIQEGIIGCETSHPLRPLPRAWALDGSVQIQIQIMMLSKRNRWMSLTHLRRTRPRPAVERQREILVCPRED